jgi:hypothetical protein
MAYQKPLSVERTPGALRCEDTIAISIARHLVVIIANPWIWMQRTITKTIMERSAMPGKCRRYSEAICLPRAHVQSDVYKQSTGWKRFIWSDEPVTLRKDLLSVHSNSLGGVTLPSNNLSTQHLD